MLKKNKQLILITISVVLVSIVFILNSPLTYKKNISILEEEKIASSLPVEIKIPTIDVSASIKQVGVTKDGAMDAPEGPADTGWYNLGPHPGEKGNAVIDGHSGWKDGIPAVFDNLHKLQKGDKIYIKDEEGTSLVFMVREVKKYDPNDHAREVFYSDDNKSHLNLITCEGDWNKVTKSRSERLVVFTDLIT